MIGLLTILVLFLAPPEGDGHLPVCRGEGRTDCRIEKPVPDEDTRRIGIEDVAIPAVLPNVSGGCQ